MELHVGHELRGRVGEAAAADGAEDVELANLAALNRARPPHHVRVLVAHRLQRPREGPAHPQPSGEPEPEAQRHSTNWSPSQF